jgi:hypothetical protein
MSVQLKVEGCNGGSEVMVDYPKVDSVREPVKDKETFELLSKNKANSFWCHGYLSRNLRNPTQEQVLLLNNNGNLICPFDNGYCRNHS